MRRVAQPVMHRVRPLGGARLFDQGRCGAVERAEGVDRIGQIARRGVRPAEPGGMGAGARSLVIDDAADGATPRRLSNAGSQ